MHARTVDLDGLGVEIDDQVTSLDDGLGVAFRPTHNRVYPRDQFVLVERLGHVIVGAEAKPSDFILGPRQAGQDQDRRFHLRDAQAAQHLKAGHIRQVQIEKNDVVIVDFPEIDAFFSKIGRIDVKALGFQHKLD